MITTTVVFSIMIGWVWLVRLNIGVQGGAEPVFDGNPAKTSNKRCYCNEWHTYMCLHWRLLAHTKLLSSNTSTLSAWQTYLIAIFTAPRNSSHYCVSSVQLTITYYTSKAKHNNLSPTVTSSSTRALLLTRTGPDTNSPLPQITQMHWTCGQVSGCGRLACPQMPT